MYARAAPTKPTFPEYVGFVGARVVGVPGNFRGNQARHQRPASGRMAARSARYNHERHEGRDDGLQGEIDQRAAPISVRA